MAHYLSRRNRRLAGAVIATAGGMASVSNASPLASVTMIGKDITQGQTVFSVGPINVGVGDTIVYSLLTFLNATGVTNANIGVPFSVKVNNTDGINALSFDAYQLASDQIQVDFKNAIPVMTSVTGSGATNTISPAEGVSLVTGTTGWKSIPSANGGHLGHDALSSRASNDLISVRPGMSPGTFRGLNSSQAAGAMGTGLFVVTGIGSGALTPVRLRYLPTSLGGFGGDLQINDGTTGATLNEGQELGPDPLVVYGNNDTNPAAAPSLTLIAPEPGSLCLLGLAAAGIVIRRKARNG